MISLDSTTQYWIALFVTLILALLLAFHWFRKARRLLSGKGAGCGSGCGKGCGSSLNKARNHPSQVRS